MAVDASKEIGEFLSYSLGDEGFLNSHVYLATLEKGVDFKQYMVQWPLHKKAVVNFVLEQAAEDRDVYFCPTALFKGPAEGVRPKAKKEFAVPTGIILLDFDHQTAPKDWASAAESAGVPEPTQIVQSSVPGNEHAYWKLPQGEYDVEFIEERTRALTYRLDSDKGGWDIGQLARIPYTLNHGYDHEGEYKDWREPLDGPVVPTVLKSVEGVVHPSAFSEVKKAETEALHKINLDMSLVTSAEEALALGPTTPEIMAHVKMSAAEATKASPDGRSGSLQRLTYMLAETGGFSDEQIYSVLLGADSVWLKYFNRTEQARKKEYLNCIARARAKHGYLSLEEMTFSGLLNSKKEEGETADVKFLYDLDEFLDAEFQFDWIMRGLISRRGLVIITGQPGVGKTQFMIDLTMSLALGKDYLDYVNEMGPCRVLFLSLEMGGPELQIFWRASASDPKYGDRATLGKNTKVIPTGTDMDLTRADYLAWFKNLLAEVKPDVVVIDSLQMMTSQSLSDETETRNLMKMLKKVASEFECGLIMVHHERKRQPGAKNDTGSLSDMYGAQWIAANIDKVISLSDDVEIQGQVLLAEWKSRLSARRHTPLVLERSNHLTFSELTAPAFMTTAGKEDLGEGIHF